MRPDVTARLDGVEKALDRLFVPVEVMIHPPTGMLRGFGTDAVEEGAVDEAGI
jgi:hypothetical protein